MAGAVWQLAVSPDQRYLAAACEDGSVKLFDLECNAEQRSARHPIPLAYTLPCHPSRVVSVAFNPDGSQLAVGGSKGFIKLWSLPFISSSSSSSSLSSAPPKATAAVATANREMKDSGRISFDPSSDSDSDSDSSLGENPPEAASSFQPPRCVRTIRMPAQSSKKAVVWALQYLAGAVLASGDSLASTCFWDTVTGTLLSQYTSHLSDVTSLAAPLSPSPSLLLSAGNDGTLTVYQEVSGQWLVARTIPVSPNDLRALAFLSPDSVVCGGTDTQLSFAALASERHDRVLRLFPPCPSLAPLAAPSRLLLCRHQSRIDLWRLGPADPDLPSFVEDRRPQLHPREGPLLLASLSFDGLSLAAAAISPDGRFLACACPAKLWLFAFDADSHSLTPLLTPFRKNQGFHQLAFASSASPSSTPILVAASALAGIETLRLDTGALSTLPVGDASHAVVALATSSDGHWLAALRTSNLIQLYDLRSPPSSSAPQPFSLPATQFRPTALRFHPSTDVLYISTVVGEVLLFDPSKGHLLSSRIDIPRIKRGLAKASASPDGLSFHPAAETQGGVMLYWHSAIHFVSPGHSSKKSSGFVLRKRLHDFTHTLLVDFLSDHELVIVQRPWSSIKTHFPIPANKRRFRT